MPDERAIASSVVSRRGSTLIKTGLHNQVVARPLAVTVEDVCFCHWPVEQTALARAVPDWLTVETAEGDAWLTAIPHTVTAISALGTALTAPAEAVTVRTYVRGPNDQRGLYFFAVIPEGPLASAGAMPVLGLPTRRGRHARPPSETFRSRRTLDIDGQRVLDVQYSPDDDAAPAPPDTLAAFLVERHRYFTEGTLGTRLVGNVGHDPWSLARLEATVTSSVHSTLDLPAPIGDPLVQYSPGMELGVAPPRPVWLD